MDVNLLRLISALLNRINLLKTILESFTESALSDILELNNDAVMLASIAIRLKSRCTLNTLNPALNKK